VRQKAEAQQKQEEIHEEEWEATSPYRENLIQNILLLVTTTRPSSFYELFDL
jgi:hypothetical protein